MFPHSLTVVLSTIVVPVHDSPSLRVVRFLHVNCQPLLDGDHMPTENELSLISLC